MNWLLLRHADAEMDAPTDLERPLSVKGQQQAMALASWLSAYRCQPDVILSSTALRAWQTAQPIASALRIECIPCPWARPGMAPEEAFQHLNAFNSFGCVMLVGHQPDLALLAAQALGSIDPSRIHVRKASTLHLKFISRTAARLEALFPCPALP